MNILQVNVAGSVSHASVVYFSGALLHLYKFATH